MNESSIHRRKVVESEDLGRWSIAQVIVCKNTDF